MSVYKPYLHTIEKEGILTLRRENSYFANDDDEGTDTGGGDRAGAVVWSSLMSDDVVLAGLSIAMSISPSIWLFLRLSSFAIVEVSTCEGAEALP
jgi:hypothetical protein